MSLAVLAAVLAAVLGALAGSARRTTTPALGGITLLVAAAAAQVAAAWIGTSAGPARLALQGVAVVCAAAFLVGNLHAPGIPLVAAGLLLNVLVVAANGAMPVSVEAARQAGVAPGDLGLGRDPSRELLDDASRLPWLADVIAVPLPVHPEVVSAGDVLVAAGVLLLVLSLVRRPAGASGRAAAGTGDVLRR